MHWRITRDICGWREKIMFSSSPIKILKTIENRVYYMCTLFVTLSILSQVNSNEKACVIEIGGYQNVILHSSAKIRTTNGYSHKY